MIKKLTSRKFLLTLLGTVLTAVLTQVGLPLEIAGFVIGALGGSYNIGQGIADAGEQGRIQMEES